MGVAFLSADDPSPESQLQGVYVAQHEHNSSSSPFKLRILIANTGREVSYVSFVARQIAQIASQDPTIVGVVGWLTSSRSHESLPSLANAKLPQVSPQASDDGLSAISPYFFRVTSSSNADTALFQDALPTSGQFATLRVISGGSGYVAHKNSYNRWFFTDFAYPDEWGIVVGKNYPPFFHDYSTDFNPRNQQPIGIYGYTRADDHTILSYDATQVLITGIQMALASVKATPTAQDVANALPKIAGAQAYQGVSGQIAFDANHDPINKAVMFLYTSADGHLQMKSYQGCFIKGCP